MSLIAWTLLFMTLTTFDELSDKLVDYFEVFLQREDHLHIAPPITPNFSNHHDPHDRHYPHEKVNFISLSQISYLHQSTLF